MAGLLPLDEAQARLLALAEALPIETIAVAEAGGRWAASDIIAPRSQPAADLSAMEGYSVPHTDFPGLFRLLGIHVAGAGFSGSSGTAEAMRFLTGFSVS